MITHLSNAISPKISEAFHGPTERLSWLTEAKYQSSSDFDAQYADGRPRFLIHSVGMTLPFSRRPYTRIDPDLRREIELDMLRFRWARQQAEEIVRDRGWSEKDEDFWIQIDEEAKRQWTEDCERDFLKRLSWEERWTEDCPPPR